MRVAAAVAQRDQLREGVGAFGAAEEGGVSGLEVGGGDRELGC